MTHLSEVTSKMTQAAKNSGRKPEDVRLIAVSKTKPLTAVTSLASEGQIDFGENTIQDAETKIPHCKNLTWHFIGHLQSNKTKYMPELFDWVHTIDSLKLVTRINAAAISGKKTINLLLQVNVANDKDKTGLRVNDLFPMAEQILNSSFSGIALKGVMTIGRKNATKDQSRQTFEALRQLAENAAQEFGTEYFSELSMGMSDDFEMAIEEGATMVRVGAALFGGRGAHPI
ncbi:MAG: YggS family pyridoxal phosphate-dependent enzyme [Gammaproteobacteria bacterium]